jgi:hypothetical protein
MKTETKQSAEYVKLVVRRLYDAQKLRIQSDLRMQRLIRGGIVLQEDAEKTFQKARELEAATEKEYERIVWREIKDLPIVEQWLSKVRGIGPRLAGLLVALIGDIERFATVSKLWAYAGLHVKEGKAVRLVKGQKANWSTELKTTCYKISESLWKLGGPYQELGATYKEYLIAREVGKGNVIWRTDEGGKKTIAFAPRAAAASAEPMLPPEQPEWTLGRIHAMARRRMVKLFLSHLWSVWREIEGLECKGAFVVDRLGHEPLDPWSMIEHKLGEGETD